MAFKRVKAGKVKKELKNLLVQLNRGSRFKGKVIGLNPIRITERRFFLNRDSLFKILLFI